MYSSTNKRKIVNDPVYGFINIQSDLVYDIIEHPWFQRLRRIKQLGMTNYVYPGATHTRFQHAIGTTYLMDLALNIIRSKGHTVTEEEAEGVTVAILLHDIGHGPFSHALEKTLIDSTRHEELSIIMMNLLNFEFKGKLELAIQIFTNQYPKRFLNQLVSGQLDMDRLDYLKRDSFFTGVTEGVIGSDRIIKMLNVVNDQLVVEAKGIYSIEKFLIARRLMYWQVYLHKTVLSAENLLVNVLRRAKELADKKIEIFATPSLHYFLYNQISKEKLLAGDYNYQKQVLEHFTRLDDDDIICSAKEWAKCKDKTLALLSENLLNRKLYKVEMSRTPFLEETISKVRQNAMTSFGLDKEEINYLVFSDSIANYAYSPNEDNQIQILYNNGELKDISEASDILDLPVLSKNVKKYFLCYPKNV
jgi:uncharacterized protein